VARLIVQRPTPNVVTVSTPRIGAALSALFQVGFLGLWYWLLLEKPVSLEAAVDSTRRLPDRGLWVCLIGLVPLAAIPGLLRLARTVIRGSVYRCDGHSRTITLNGEVIARFDEVEHVQVRMINRAKAPNEYLLSLLLQNDRKVQLGQARDHDEALSVADSVADTLQVTVRSV
jgi:hypothetical protein